MNKELVKFLEGQLALAKRGELLAMAAIFVGPESEVLTSWSGATDQNVYKILGAIHVLEREFADEHVEGLRAA